MDSKFQPNLNETILYHSRPSRTWYALLWRIGLGVVEVTAFLLISFTAFTSLTTRLLTTFLPVDIAYVISQILFQGIAPLLVVAWFAEDTARIFSSELILTDQRVWTKGFPYAWSLEREMPINEVKSMSARRDALFIHLRSTKKVQVHVLSDGKQIVKAFIQLTGKKDAH
jgi:hypothetical protein